MTPRTNSKSSEQNKEETLGLAVERSNRLPAARACWLPRGEGRNSDGTNTDTPLEKCAAADQGMEQTAGQNTGAIIQLNIMSATETKTATGASPAVDNQKPKAANVPFQLRKMPIVAPRGEQRGQFISVVCGDLEILKDDKKRQLVTVFVQLEATDKNKNPFVVTKVYNVKGRGDTAFEDDYKSWSGEELTPEQMDDFDPSIIVGKPVVVQITHRKEGKELVPVIEKFLPATVPETQPA
jgi:hypothetical protein